MTDIPHDVPVEAESENGAARSPINYSTREVWVPHDLNDRMNDYPDVDWEEVAVQAFRDVLDELEG